MAKSVIAPTTALFPVPVVLVSCRDRSRSRSNLITIAWCGNVCSEPPSISISVRPSRHSYALIRREREFSVNIPSADLLRQTDLAGVISGRDADKFAECGFTPGPASKISSSLVKECPVNIECRLARSLRLGTHDLFVGRIVALHADADVLDAEGRIDPARVNAVAFCQHQYWSLGKRLAHYGFSKTK
jgi:flavin reductase (DIM6/NTAB) family NADH-FMN oxidoreductase RutF